MTLLEIFLLLLIKIILTLGIVLVGWIAIYKLVSIKFPLVKELLGQKTT